MNNYRGNTYQGLLQHMKHEFAEEIFEFFQQVYNHSLSLLFILLLLILILKVALFKNLNMFAPEEQALAKASAKQIWEVYVTNGASKEVFNIINNNKNE